VKRITVITSVFNGDEFIEGFLEDITQQTIFDDCLFLLVDCNNRPVSKEGSLILEYTKKYKNIKYEKKAEHSGIGIYEAWNYMIKNSETEYITNANLDDRLFSRSIEEHINLLDNNKEIDVAYCYNLMTNEPNYNEKKLLEKYHNSVHQALKSKKFSIFPCYEFSLESLLQTNSPHNHPVWRRSLHEKNGYFSTEYKSASDWEFWLRCALNGAKMKLIPEVLGIYYHNPKGMSTASENMQRNLAEVAQIYSIYSRKIK
jgi:hypothetical protein